MSIQPTDMQPLETQRPGGFYFRAFEAGTIPEDTCAPLIAALNQQAKALEVSRRTRRAR